MRGFKQRAALLTTVTSFAVVALVGVAISPAGAALRPVESTALHALIAARPVIDASAATCAIGSSGACIPPSVSLGSTFTLSDRIAITGQVTATCGPFQTSSFFFTFGFVNLRVDQPSGHEVAHAFGGANANCDGTPHTYAITAIAENVPFRTGTAVATGSVQASGTDSSFTFVNENASVTNTVTLTK